MLFSPDTDSMTQCIHYEDNIFLVLDYLTYIQRGLRLDIDDNYFGEKIITDLMFFDSILHSIFNSLKESTIQKDKNQYLRLLLKTINLYTAIGEEIVDGSTGRLIDFSGFKPKLKELVLEQKKTLKELKAILDSNSLDEDNEDQISQEEMLFLMSGGDEEDGGETP